MSDLITSLEAGSGLSNPTLSFGLTEISDWSTQMPFLDLMKMSRPWIGHSSTEWSAMSVDELEAGGYLDADGWPMSIPEGLTSIGTVWAWDEKDTTAAATRQGVYVLNYEGTGTLQVIGATVLSSEPGRIVVENVTGGTMLLRITSTDPGGTGDYIRNITMVAQEYEALLEMGQTFNPDWLAIVQDARELRFMDWMHTNGTTSAEWEDRPQVGDVTWRSVPVEVMVELANQTGTEPWFTMPAGASEEYIRNFATYVRDNLDPRLEVHVEYSNELWNWAFDQTKWVGEQALEDWGVSGGPAWLNYAAMLATKSALIWDEVFGADADHRVDNVLGTQASSAWTSSYLLRAPLWQTSDPTGYVAPHSVFDSLAVTTYFGVNTVTNSQLRAELLTLLNTPGVDATAWLADKLMDPDYPGSIPQTQAWWAENKAVADQYGIDLIAYEGGQHVMHSFAVAGLSTADLATLTDFLTDFVRSEAMAELYQALWTAWAAVSDGPFMQFGDVAAASKYGAWGLLSALGDTNPRADLLMDLNENSTAWFGDGGGAQYQQGVIEVAGDAGETLLGTNDDDFLIGGDGDDLIVAGLGDDAIAGEGGQDTLVLSGTPSDYTLVAEANGYRLTATGLSHYLRSIEAFEFEGGVTISLADMLRITEARNDQPDATNGHDALVGGTGNDSIDAQKGNDSVYASNGADEILGNAGFDLIFGGSGNDILNGGSGGDTLIGGTGADQMQGGMGNDSYYVESSADLVTELAGQGFDVIYSTVSQTLAENIENLVLIGAGAVNGTGTGLGNKLTGNAADNRLFGLDGDDTLLGGAGNDMLDGGTGDDLMIGGQGDDFYLVDSTADRVSEAPGGGVDTLRTLVSFGLTANIENLTLVGTASIDGTGNALANSMIGNSGDNRMSGSSGDDTLFGAAGADTLDGGRGADSMSGGLGDDLFIVDDLADLVRDLDGGGTDTVQASVSHSLSVWVENLVLTGNAAIDGTGNARANHMTGNDAANVLLGGAGDDILVGGAGGDTLSGGSGADQFVFNSTASGTDLITDFNGLDGDVLRFDGLLTGSFAYVGAAGFSGGNDNSEARVVGNQVRIDTDGDGTSDITLTMTGLVDAAQLTADNFVFG